MHLVWFDVDMILLGLTSDSTHLRNYYWTVIVTIVDAQWIPFMWKLLRKLRPILFFPDGVHYFLCSDSKETMVSVVVIGAVFLAVTALVIALSWKRFLRRLHLMAAAAATGSHTPARYSRSPQNFHRFIFTFLHLLCWTHYWSVHTLNPRHLNLHSTELSIVRR